MRRLVDISFIVFLLLYFLPFPQIVYDYVTMIAAIIGIWAALIVVYCWPIVVIAWLLGAFDQPTKVITIVNEGQVIR